MLAQVDIVHSSHFREKIITLPQSNIFWRKKLGVKEWTQTRIDLMAKESTWNNRRAPEIIEFPLHESVKGSPTHVAPAQQGPGKGLMYAAFPWISARGCFQDLNPWPHGHKATALPLRQSSPSTWIQWWFFFLKKLNRITGHTKFIY
jgi:hypothetical protein